MMVEELNCGSGTGYLEVPLHVLYKNEYIESAYANIQRKGRAKCLFDNCKETFIKIFIKLKDFLSCKFGVQYHREYVLNNVDKKTKNNLISYFQSLNLKIKEYYDHNNTKVIEVDIAPIKNKPDMNDLLVYIENEKIKIARREERGRSKEFSKSGQWSTEHNITSYGVRTSVNDKLTLKNSTEFKLTRQRIEESIKKIEEENKKYLFKNEISTNTLQIGGAIKEKSINKIIEDPLTKAENRIKSQIKSKSNVQKRKEIKTKTEDKNSTNIDKLKDGLMSPLMNPNINNGVGVFWTAEKIKYNDTNINMITRANNIKEESINVIKKLTAIKNDEKSNAIKNNEHIERNIKEEKKFSKVIEESKYKEQIKVKLSKSEIKQNINKELSDNINEKTETPLIELKNYEPYMVNGVTSSPNFPIEIKDTINEDLFLRTDSMAVNVDEKENTKKKRKFSKFIKKVFKKKNRRSKKDIVVNTNITDANLGQENDVEGNNKALRSNENKIDKNDIICDFALMDYSGGTSGFQDNKNKLFPPNKTDKDRMKQKNQQYKKNIAKDGHSNIETSGDCINNNKSITSHNDDKNITNIKKEKIETRSIQKNNVSKIMEITNNKSKQDRSELSDKKESNRLLQHTPVTNFNIQSPEQKLVHTREKDFNKSSIKLWPNKDLSFNWKNIKIKTTKIDRKKKLSVIKKLYNKLKINSKELSDSEDTSTSDTLVESNIENELNHYELSWSSLESNNGMRSSSSDTVHSVTNTVIKKLAKRPKKKRN